MTPALTGEERRIHARHTVNFSVRFRRLQASDNTLEEEAELAGTDLSLGGLGAAGSLESVGGIELKPGTKMMLKLRLGDEEDEILIPAKVMWSKTQGAETALHFAGLKFVFLSDEGNLRIQNFVVKASLMQQYRS